MTVDRARPSAAVAPRRTRPRDRKASILRAAADAFSAQGYHGTAMADIAAKLDISSTALYRHFRNKQDLLGQTLLQGLDSTLARLEEADGAGSVLDALVDTALDFRGLPRLWQLEARNLSAQDRVSVLLRVLRLSVLLRRAVAAQRADLSPENVEFVAWCALSIAVSPSHHAMRVSHAVFAGQLRAMIAAIVAIDLAPAAAMRSRPLAHWTDTLTEGPLERDLRRERLIAAAARLFSTHGYTAVGMEDIGAAAGITGPSVYHHFAAKADLLAAVLDRSEQWMTLYTARALTVGSTPHESLDLLLRSYVQIGVEQTGLVATMATEASHLPLDRSERHRAAVRDAIVRWAGLLQVALPDLDPDTARVRVQAVTTIVVDTVRNDLIRHRADLADALTAVCAAAMYAPAESQVT